MTTTAMHVALLRGINVGGRTLPMKDLAAMFENAGCENVRTYIASGNVVFAAGSTLARRIPSIVGTAIREDFGFESPIITRSATRLAAIVADNPFLETGADQKMLHVGFLAAAPSSEAVARLDPQRSPTDEFIVRGSELYLHCPEGLARTKLTNAWFDRTLDTISTVRNWRTTCKLLDMANG